MVVSDPALEPWTSARLNHRDFRRLGSYVEEVCGIRIPEGKQVMVEVRLRHRLRALGLRSFSDYCERLLSPSTGPEELPFFIDEITTNKTDFFREDFHFQYLTKHALPDLETRGAGSHHPLSAWSAACSSGEEPYTLAMVLTEASQERPGFRFRILGTDICNEVLSVAKRAVYEESRIDPVPRGLRAKYFMRSRDRDQPLVRVVPALRSTVSLRRLNLLDADYDIAEPMDIVFCRNVLIYFSHDTQVQVCRRLCHQLRPGGYLFMGHSETINGMNLPVTQVVPTIYQKPL